MLLLGLISCSGLSCSAAHQKPNAISAASAPSINAQADKSRTNNHDSEHVDPLLIEAIRERHSVSRVFAWGGLATDGRITWVDDQGHLRSASFTKSNTGYTVFFEGEEKTKPLTSLLNQRDLAPLVEYLADTEFPVRADTLDVGGCRARVILLRRAGLRTFGSEKNDKYDIDWLGLRVILNQDAILTSNSTTDFELFSSGQVVVDDINGDGVKDYVFIGLSQTSIIYVWTVTSSCSFQPLTFLEDGGGSEYLEGRRIYLEKNNRGEYLIHVISAVPLKSGQTTDEGWRWNQSNRAFVRTRIVDR